jgi:hypothetical protein
MIPSSTLGWFCTVSITYSKREIGHVKIKDDHRNVGKMDSRKLKEMKSDSNYLSDIDHCLSVTSSMCNREGS